MLPLIIYYSPGARGDFLSRVIFNKITIPTFKVNGYGYNKIHHAYEFVEFETQRKDEYVLRISMETAAEIFHTAILSFKNQPNKTINECCDELFIISKNYYVDQLESVKFSYSNEFKFRDFDNISAINNLCSHYGTDQLSDDMIAYVLDNNSLNNNHIDLLFQDLRIQRVFNLFEFEMNMNCLFKPRTYSIDDYLSDDSFQKYLTLENYTEGFRPR